MTADGGFVGREQEQAELVSLLDRLRLVTVLGPGGIGKTRLATESVKAAASNFPGGVSIVELAGTTDDDDIKSVFARQLGVDSLEAVLLRAAEHATLVVLDNCESALEQIADLAAMLLEGAPTITVLATSRVPLRKPGEYRMQLAPLAVPEASQTMEVDTIPAVQLFLERAEAAGAPWTRTAENLLAIADLVRRLDGLPLAIELAAARSRVLAPIDLLDMLAQQLDVLRRPGSETDRHYSLRTVIEASYEPLSPDLQRTLRQLAVIPAPFDVQIALGVLGADDGDSATLDMLSQLVDASLVDLRLADDGRTHYRLLDSVRAFGLEVLAAECEEDRAHDRYVDAMVSFADKVGREAQKAFAPDLLDRIRRNFVHLAVAIGWCVEHDETPKRAYRMFLLFYGPTGARDEVTALADRMREAWVEPARLQAEVWAVMATSFFLTGRYDEGRDLAGAAVDHQLGSPFAKFIGHRTLGYIDALYGRPQAARHHLEQAIEYAGFSDAFVRELQISWAAVVVDPSESPRALEVLEQASSAAALNDEKLNVLWAAVTTAFHRVLLGDIGAASRAAAAAVAVSDQTGLPWSISTAHRVMGSVRAREQGWSAAAPHFRLAVDRSLESGDLEGMASALRAAAGGAKYVGDHELAERLWATIPPLPGLPVLRSIFHQQEEQLMDDLGPPTALDAQTLVKTARALLGPTLTESADGPTRSSTSSEESVIRFGRFELDQTRHELRCDGERVHIEPQVFDVLAYLVERRSSLVTKNELLDNVWGDRFVSDGALSSRIASARKATGDDGQTQAVIRTVHGKGFIFVAEIH